MQATTAFLLKLQDCAICVLSDLDIVVSEKEAELPLNRDKSPPTLLNNLISVKPLKYQRKIFQSVDRKNRDGRHSNQYLSELIQASEHFRSMNPFMPFEIHITKDCHYLNRNLSDIQFWQNMQELP